MRVEFDFNCYEEIPRKLLIHQQSPGIRNSNSNLN